MTDRPSSFYDQATGLVGVYDGLHRLVLYNTDGEVVDETGARAHNLTTSRVDSR